MQRIFRVPLRPKQVNLSQVKPWHLVGLDLLRIHCACLLTCMQSAAPASNLGWNFKHPELVLTILLFPIDSHSRFLFLLPVKL